MPGETAVWIDGAQVSALPLPDRGLEFGDGLFETLLVRDNEALYPEFHFARLQRGLRVLGFPECVAAVRPQLRLAITDIAARGWRWSALRVTLTRGAGPRGYASPADATPRIVISASSLGERPSRMATPAVLGLAAMRWPCQPALAGIKHLSRLEQVLAATEYSEMGVDEAVMLDQQGRVVSVVAGNLFLVVEGQLQTAPLDTCGIAGTRRELIIQRWAPALGLPVREKAFTPEQLEAAEEVFYSNSLLGLRPVASFGSRTWNSHAVCEALYRQYKGDLA